MDQAKTTLATLNLQWCGDPVTAEAPERRAQLAERIQQLGADTVVLTEYKEGPSGEALQALLQQEGFAHFLVPEHMPRHKLGCAVASRLPLIATSPVHKPPTEPWRAISFMQQGIEVHGMYVPATAPAIFDFWNWLLDTAARWKDRPGLLMGDFNTGVSSVDSSTYQFAAHEQFVALQSMGFVDLWRRQHPEERDYTWYSSTGNGFRLDHAFASPAAASAVSGVWLDHAPRLSGASDHSAVVLSLENI